MNLLYVQVGGSLVCLRCVVGSPHYPPDYCCRLSLVALLYCACLISSCILYFVSVCTADASGCDVFHAVCLQAVSDIARNWVLANKDQHKHLKTLQDKNSKKEVKMHSCTFLFGGICEDSLLYVIYRYRLGVILYV